MPPSASSNWPGLVFCAPVNEPRSWPNSSDSSSSPGSAAQLILMNTRPARAERAWISRATTSLPTPDSPVMSTGTSASAMRSMSSSMARIDGAVPSVAREPPREPDDGTVTSCALPDWPAARSRISRSSSGLNGLVM